MSTAHPGTWCRLSAVSDKPESPAPKLYDPQPLKALDAPSVHGEEFLRASLDDGGQLHLSLATGPLGSDVRLWGVALADIARETAKHHTVTEQIRTSALEASFAAGDSSDAELNLLLIQRQFHDDLATSLPGYPPGTGSVNPAYPAKLPDPVAADELTKGDRFVLDGQLFMVLGTEPFNIEWPQVIATNLATADIHHFKPETPVHPVRRKRD